MKTYIRKTTVFLLLAFFLQACTATLTAQPEVVTLTNDISQPEIAPISYTSALQGTGDDLETRLIALYENVNPAVVFILTSRGSGSGFVYDNAGHIVTNNHVVAGESSFEIVFSNGDRQKASLVGSDTDSDLAVVKVDTLPAGTSPIPLASYDSIRVGQIVAAIGNPFGEQGSMSMGIISGLGRSLPSQRGLPSRSTYSLPEVIQTDAPINPGNSGGPLLNLNGELIGVNAAIASESGSNAGVGFSIPVAAVEKIVPNLIADGEHTYAYMGVGVDSEISLTEQEIYAVPQIRGTYVLNVSPGSPAAEAGLVAADPTTGRGGDLITAIDGQVIRNFGDLNSYLVFHASPGQVVEITLFRDGDEITLPMTLAARP